MNKTKSIFLVYLLVFCGLGSATSYSPKLLGSFKISNPAFVTLYENPIANSTEDKYDLLISTFNPFPFSTDTVDIVKGVGKHVTDVTKIQPETITTKTIWPNEAAGVPDDVFGKRMVVIPDGFIVPFNTDGAIKVVDISKEPAVGPYVITDDSAGKWFYHRVEWVDMDGDGDKDAVTCRAREPIVFGQKASEILWLENPNGDLSVKWKPHVLGNGPDVFFRYTALQTPSGFLNCIIAAEFFTKRLTVYWTEEQKGYWNDSSKIKTRVIDATIGAVFEVQLTDINNDGKVDLLVTNNGNNGSMFAYEIPRDFRTDAFVRHTLSTGHIPLHPGQGKGAPGSPLTVQMDKSRKPTIFLSGDDEGTAYMLTPISEDSNNWVYNQTLIVRTGKDTVGQMACADVNGDGLKELFIPSYSTSEVLVFSYGQ